MFKKQKETPTPPPPPKKKSAHYFKEIDLPVISRSLTLPRLMPQTRQGKVLTSLVSSHLELLTILVLENLITQNNLTAIANPKQTDTMNYI